MSAVRILRFADTQLEAQTAEEAAAALAANAALFATGDIGGAIGGDEINAMAINADGMQEVVSAETEITFKAFGDGELFHTEIVTDEEPFRLPTSDMYKTFEYELIGFSPVKEVSIAPSMEELDA